MKLFDGGIGKIIELGITVSHSKTWYPLNFNVAGYMIHQFFKIHVGNFHFILIAIGPSFAQYREKNHFFTFYTVPTFINMLFTKYTLSFDKRKKKMRNVNSIISFFPVPIITTQTITAKKIENFNKNIRTVTKKIASPNEPSMFPNPITYQPRNLSAIGFATA